MFCGVMIKIDDGDIRERVNGKQIWLYLLNNRSFFLVFGKRCFISSTPKGLFECLER